MVIPQSVEQRRCKYPPVPRRTLHIIVNNFHYPSEHHINLVLSNFALFNVAIVLLLYTKSLFLFLPELFNWKITVRTVLILCHVWTITLISASLLILFTAIGTRTDNPYWSWQHLHTNITSEKLETNQSTNKSYIHCNTPHAHFICSSQFDG